MSDQVETSTPEGESPGTLSCGQSELRLPPLCGPGLLRFTRLWIQLDDRGASGPHHARLAPRPRLERAPNPGTAHASCRCSDFRGTILWTSCYRANAAFSS